MAAIEETNIHAMPRLRPAVGQPVEKNTDLLWNVLTVLVWLMTASLIMAFVSIYVNPGSLLNPFKSSLPPTLVAAVHIPSQTPSPQPTAAVDSSQLTPTPTFTPTATQTAPQNALQTAPQTAPPSPVPTETATPGPSLTPTIHSLYPFILRGDIKVIDGATFPDHDACKLWVAGQAYDLQGAPMVGITVMLGGYLDWKNVYQLSLTGTALQYGPAGYEFTVADTLVKSKQSVWVELFDQAMIPLSGKIYFDTSADCSQNLILINFRQVR